MTIERKAELRSLCEAEQLETYKRRDNLKIFNVDEEIHKGTNGFLIPEPPESTINKALQIRSNLGAAVDVKDISIAHRLRAKKGTNPIIVRFSRRMAKIDIMKKKRKLFENGSQVKIFEDVSRARLTFINTMKSDNGISAVWTKEGSILYTFHNDREILKIYNLYDGTIDLNYDAEDALQCFPRQVFPSGNF